MNKNYNFFKRHSYLSIVLLYFFIFIPIIFLRFQDLRNEIKYFIVTEQFLTEKNLFVLSYFNSLYPDKPPLYFWILGISKYISGQYFPIVGIILGSLIPSIVIVILFYKMVIKIKDENMAFSSAIALAMLPLFAGLTMFLRMDMLMTMFIFIALYLFFGFYYKWFNISGGKLTLFYLAIFLGLFTKGVAGIAIPILIPLVFLALERDVKFLKKIKFPLGFLFVLALTLLWFALIYFSPRGIDYISLMLGRETVGRIVNSKAHVKPFYYYLKVLPPLMFPYTIAIVWGIILGFKNIKRWREWEIGEKIGFIWMIVPLVMFSLASGKLAVYLLPIFPGAIIFIHSLLLKEDSKIKNIILKSCEILSVLPFIISLIDRKKRDVLSRINRINYSLIILMFCTIGGLNYYNDNYTAKPFVKLVRAHKISAYNFEDGLNLVYYTTYPIKNYEDIQELKETLPNYLMTKVKYGDDLKELGYKVSFKNKVYGIYER